MPAAGMVTDGGPCAQVRPELGVYLLGAIEPARRSVVESHLAACLNCRAELTGLAGLPSLLRRVPADVIQRLAAGEPEQAIPEPLPDAPLARIGAIRRRRNLLAAAAAAAAAIAAACAVQVLHDATAQPPAAVAPAGRSPSRRPTRKRAPGRPSATPPSRGVPSSRSASPDSAGTRCQLLVSGPRGQVINAGGWDFAAGSQAAWYPASVPIPAASLRRFTIVVGGKTVVTIQAR